MALIKVAINFGYEYFFFVIYFSNIFFFQNFFILFFSESAIFNLFKLKYSNVSSMVSHYEMY